MIAEQRRHRVQLVKGTAVALPSTPAGPPLCRSLVASQLGCLTRRRVAAHRLWFELKVVMPDPRCFPVFETVLTVTRVTVRKPAHHISRFEQAGLWVLYKIACRSVVCDNVQDRLDQPVRSLKISGCQRRRARPAVMRTRWARPDTVKVPRLKGLLVPRTDVCDDCGAALRVNVDTRRLPPDGAESTPDRAGP